MGIGLMVTRITVAVGVPLKGSMIVARRASGLSHNLSDTGSVASNHHQAPSPVDLSKNTTSNPKPNAKS